MQNKETSFSMQSHESKNEKLVKQEKKKKLQNFLYHKINQLRNQEIDLTV